MYCTECYYKNPEGVEFCEGCGRPFYTPKEDVQPLLKNRYKMISILAEGGKGAISLAYDVRLNKTCAIKRIFSQCIYDLQDEEKSGIVDSFKKEAEVLAKLRHPNLPCVTDYFIDDGFCYVIMDYIEGKDFELLLEEEGGEGLPEKQVIEWAIQICRVLEYLHGQPVPVIHGDLKPANIIVRDADGWIMLVDFGSAQFQKISGEERMSQELTIGYAPPEQYRGKVEVKSDIYSLGATIYELLSGGLPEEEFNFIPLREIAPHISQDMEKAVMKCLEYDMEKRFNSAGELKQALLDVYKNNYGSVESTYKTSNLADEGIKKEKEEKSHDPKIEVFIVDDEIDLLETFTKVVKFFKGMAIAGTASNGREAVQFILEAEKKPDVIMMDIDMPLMNGIEATRKIKESLPDSKIVIMTAHLREENFFEALEAGATGYMIKGETSWEEMEETIKKAFDGGVPISSTASPLLIKAALRSQLAPEKKKDRSEKKIAEVAEEIPSIEAVVEADMADKYSEAELKFKEESEMDYVTENFIDNAEEVIEIIEEEVLPDSLEAESLELHKDDIYATHKLISTTLLEFQEAWAYNILGDKYYQSEEKDFALGCYLRAVEIDHNYLEAHFNVARLILEECEKEGFKDKGKMDKVLFHLNKCIEVVPGTIMARAAEEYIKQINTHQDTVSKEESNKEAESEISSKVSSVADEISEKVTAREVTSRIVLDSENAVFYNEMGKKYYRLNKKDLAIENYEKALEVYPLYQDAHFNLARLILEQCEAEGFKDDVNTGKVLFHFNKCIEIDPESDMAEEAQVWIKKIASSGDKYEKEQTKEVTGDLEKAREIEKEVIFAGTLPEDKELSEEEYDTFDIIPSGASSFKDPGAYNALGEKYHRRDKKDLALENYKKALEIDPEYLEAHFNIAVLLMEECGSGGEIRDRTKIDTALFHLNRCVEIAPETIIAKESDVYIQVLRDYQKAAEIQEVQGMKRTEPEESSEEYKPPGITEVERETPEQIEGLYPEREEDRRRKEEDGRREIEIRIKAEGLLQREKEITEREDEAQKREEEVLRREGEVLRREEEVMRREGELLRRESAVTEREDKIRRRESRFRSGYTI